VRLESEHFELNNAMNRLLKNEETGVDWPKRLALGFVVIGAGLRLMRYLLRYPLWHDEAFIAANFIHHGYLDLTGRLDYLQVSPILFLWAERTVVKLFGFNEWTLRAFPTFCSIAGLIVVWRLARRVAPGWPAAVAIAILAVSFAPIRHGNEVKSYATDLAIAALALWLAIRWLDGPRRGRSLWLLAALAPLAITFSLPSVFVLASVIATLALPAWRSNRWGTRAAWLGLVLSTAGAFGGVFLTHLATDQSEELRTRYLLDYWSEAFPPFEDGPLATMRWFVDVHIGNLMAYPIGSEHGGSALTFLAVLAGGAWLWKQGGRSRLSLALLAGPFAFNLLAAALGRYPYGGEARVVQHLAPSIALLSGLGAASLLRLDQEDGNPRRPHRLIFGALALVGLGIGIQSIVEPYHLKSAAVDRAFARWFWNRPDRDEPLLCLKADLGLEFEPWQWQTGISAGYRCNQRIYRGGHTAGESAQTLRPGEPVRFVLFQVESFPPPMENPRFVDWYELMEREGSFLEVRSHTVDQDSDVKDWKRSRYWVFRYRPDSACDPVALFERLGPVESLYGPPRRSNGLR